MQPDDPPEGLPALRARVDEVELAMVMCTPFAGLFSRLCDELERDNSWRMALVEVLAARRDDLIQTQGQKLAAARLREDITVARSEALEEYAR